ncbi:MAG TPA: hypothetical protein VM513_32600 [Kofleriaceae bacterium]|nr:hypothetical protein [Kofleriaceae bacterium]
MLFRSVLALTVVPLAACATAVPGEGLTDAQHGSDASTDGPRPDSPLQIDANCGQVQMELLTNEAFDGSPIAAGWVEQRIDTSAALVVDSSGDNAAIPAMSAPNKAWLGGFARATGNSDQLHQDVAVPAGATSLTLSGAYRITTLEFFGSFDLGQVDLASTTNNPFEVVLAVDNGDDTSTWTPFSKTFASAHAGETVRVRLTSSGDDSAGTSFFFDSLSLKATVTPSGCP